MGLPGPDGGKGGKHVLCGPGFTGEVPPGHFKGTATTNRVLMLLRALPHGDDMQGAIDLMQSITVHPLEPGAEAAELSWVDLSKIVGADFTPVRWEDNLTYWEVLHDLIDSEPPFAEYRNFYGELASLGIEKGKPFEPDDRMREILTRAAQLGNAQLRVQSFADRRPDRQVWPGTTWEWAVLRPENGTFDTEDYSDNYARQKWFYQAQIESPAMFKRSAGAGSLYWLNTRDATGAFLDGSKSYTLSVPQPVPNKLFWSITVYDAETRSEILTDQNRAALRSMFELADAQSVEPVDLHFGPEPPPDGEDRWIKTIPGTGWFVYFRIYGPEGPAFDGSWQLPDLQLA